MCCHVDQNSAVVPIPPPISHEYCQSWYVPMITNAAAAECQESHGAARIDV